MRSDARREVISRYPISTLVGGEPSGVVVCTTPDVWPVMLMGMQAAARSPDGPRLEEWDAFKALLVGNTSVRARRVAGQSTGETTVQPLRAAIFSSVPVWTV